MNKVIEAMALVTTRAAQLNCTVIAVLDNVILCHRGDDTYITWKVGFYYDKVEFHTGHYDMSLLHGRTSLIERAWGWGQS